MNGLDKIDITILEMLQNNAHLTIKEIAVAVNMSLTPVHERIKKLENEGIIERYVTVLNKKRLGKSMIVFCNITLNRQSLDDFQAFNEAIELLPEVVECSVVSGAFDYILKIIVSDMDAYYHFHQNKLATIKSVTQVHSFFVMNEVKYSTAIPLG
jgi:Lrp/AsnC family transcriptional regulator, leucine-responsive regulatory protein